MIKFLSLVHTMLIVFVVSFTMATWNFLVLTCHYLYVIFSLPTDSWTRAKQIEQKLAEEGTD